MAQSSHTAGNPTGTILGSPVWRDSVATITWGWTILEETKGHDMACRAVDAPSLESITFN